LIPEQGRICHGIANSDAHALASLARI